MLNTKIVILLALGLGSAASFKTAFDYAFTHPFRRGYDDRKSWHNDYGGEEEPECVPGTSWIDSTCNSCFCTPRGFAVCTSEFNYDCNQRVGRSLGRSGSWMDTGQWAPDRSAVWLPTRPQSIEWPIGQWTHSAPSQWYRPRYSGFAGVGRAIRSKRLACTEGQTWKEDCNTCHCSKLGTPACTRKRCLPEEQTSPKRQERSTSTMRARKYNRKRLQASKRRLW